MAEFENEPLPPNPVHRYYNDILYAENQSINLSISFERLLDNSPIVTDLSAELLYDEKFMRHQLATEPRIAKERMALMPFLHIGPLLEASSMPTEELKQWYDDAITGMSWLTSEEHDNTCLEYAGATVEHAACEISTVCPQRFLKGYLSDDVRFPDFQSDKYKKQPERATIIASDKLEIGIKHKILSDDASGTAWQSYCTAYDNYICGMLGLSPLDTDKNAPQ